MIIHTSPIAVFLSAFIFSVGITIGWPHHAVLSFLYVAVVLGTAIALIAVFHRQPLIVGPSYVVLLTLCNHIGLICGFSLAYGPEYMIWPVDAIDQHLPNAMAFSDWVSGKGEIVFFGDNPFSKVYVSNMWVGLFFSVFGVYPEVSSVAMLVVKLITIFLIYTAALNFTRNKSIALTAALIYGLLPTITYYTIQFYKDFFVHFLVALLLFMFSRSILKGSNVVLTLILATVPLALLFIERFYLVVMLCAALTLYCWSLTGKVFLKLAILFLACSVSYVILNYYFEGQNVQALVETIQSFQEVHNEGINVTPTTNIALDLFRIAFTPFFTVDKLNNYNDFNSLLTFGGIIHGLIMLFYFRGIWIERKNRVALINFAFLFLMYIFAYIEPYNGRARDSLYPLVAVFAAIGISSLLKRRRKESPKMLQAG